MRRILSRVSGFTRPEWLMTRDTVFLDTFASRAMSLIVSLLPELRRRAGSAGFAPLRPGFTSLFLVLGMFQTAFAETGIIAETAGNRKAGSARFRSGA